MTFTPRLDVSSSPLLLLASNYKQLVCKSYICVPYGIKIIEVTYNAVGLLLYLFVYYTKINY